MTEPIPTKIIDFRSDDSLTEVQILASTTSDNKIMQASDTRNWWLIDRTGVKTQIPISVLSHVDLTNKNSEANVQHLSSAQVAQISQNESLIEALQAGGGNYQLVTTATADILATTSIVGVDCDTIGAACTLTALTAGLVAGRTITVVAFGTGISPVTIVGQGGELLNGASSVQIVNDNRTLTLRVVDGGYNVVNPADSQSVWEKDIVDPGDTMPALGSNIVLNHDFKTDTSSWLPAANPTVTWETGGVAKIAYNGTSGPTIYQTLDSSLVGKNCEVTVRFLTDGVAGFKARMGAVNIFDETGNTSYKIVKATLVPTAGQIAIEAVTSIAGYVKIDFITIREVQTAPTNNLVPTYRARENQQPWPNDLTYWQSSQTVDGNPNEVIGTATTAPHYRRYYHPGQVGTEKTVSCRILKGVQDYMRLFYVFSTGGASEHYIIVKTSDMTIANSVGVVSSWIEPSKEKPGWYDIGFDSDTLEDGEDAYLFVEPMLNATTRDFLGNDVAVDLFAEEVHIRDGSRENNIGFIDNGASAYPLTIKQETRDDFQLRHAAGQVLTASGAWEFVENVDGYLMDESPSNVVAMRQAGLYKVVSNGTWGPLVEGVQFYANNDSGNFYEKFTGNYTDDGGLLTPSATPPVHPDPQFDYYASPVHSRGQVITESVILGINSYISSSKHASVSTSDTDAGMALTCVITGSYGDITYNLEIEYKWGGITPWT